MAGERRLAQLRARIPPPLRMSLMFIATYWGTLLLWRWSAQLADSRIYAQALVTPAGARLLAFAPSGFEGGGVEQALRWLIFGVLIWTLWVSVRRVQLPDAADRAAWWGGVASLWLVSVPLTALVGLVCGALVLEFARRSTWWAALPAAAGAAILAPAGLLFSVAAVARRPGERPILWLAPAIGAAVGLLIAALVTGEAAAALQTALMGGTDSFEAARGLLAEIVGLRREAWMGAAVVLVLLFPALSRASAPASARLLMGLGLIVPALSGELSASLSLALVSGVHLAWLSHLTQKYPWLRRPVWLALLMIYGLLTWSWMQASI